MSIGKYLTNIGVITAFLGVLGTVRQTKQMPNDWRRYIVWVVWVAGVLLAIGGVAKQADDEAEAARQKAQAKLVKQQRSR